MGCWYKTVQSRGNQRIKELLTEIDQLNEQEDTLYGDKHLEAYGRG